MVSAKRRTTTSAAAPETPAVRPTPRAEDLVYDDDELVWCPHPDCACCQCETMRAEALVIQQRRYQPEPSLSPYINRFEKEDVR